MARGTSADLGFAVSEKVFDSLRRVTAEVRDHMSQRCPSQL